MAPARSLAVSLDQGRQTTQQVGHTLHDPNQVANTEGNAMIAAGEGDNDGVIQ